MKDFTQAKQIIERNQEENVTYVDDGRSIADMNVEGFSWYMPKQLKRERQALSDLKITGKERRAMIWGALQVLLPISLFLAFMYLGAFLLLGLWLQ